MLFRSGPSDTWVEDAVKEAKNKDLVAINLLKALGDDAVMDVSVEGMQEGAHHHDHDDHDHDGEEAHDHDEHDHDHDNHAGHVHNHEDEHIWLSLRNAQKLSRVMAMELAFLDAEHAALYLNNQKAYAEKLDALDKQYQKVVEGAGQKTILFGDRFPFRYLAEDYDLTYYAAFSGCSAATEASSEAVAFLANKIDALKLPAVLILDGSDGKIAKAVLNASKDAARPVQVLDAMQTVNKQMVEEGTTYLGIMEKNLDVLKDIL